jgi:O-antigen/teichoic acid export membrane protein
MTTAAVTVAIVAREFFRQTFFVFGVPQLTLVVDAVYGVTYLALIGFWVRHAGQPAAAAVLAAGIASLVAAGAGLVFYRVRLGGSLVIDFGPLRETWAPAKWGVPGMLLAWLQNQGFFYLLGGFLGTTAVATVSASRMLLMPIPMLITAVESVLRPRAADWVGRREFARLTRQLLAMTGTAAVASAGFVGVIFAARHFVVEVVLRRTIDDLDLLLVCWGVVFLAQVLRTNITVLLQALERFDVLFYLTVVRGVISFSLGWLGMIVIGAPGILVGLAIGEVAYVATGAAAARRQLREAKR